MYRIVFSFFSGLTVILMSSLPLTVHANVQEGNVNAHQGEFVGRQGAGIDGQQNIALTTVTNRNLYNRYRDSTLRSYGYGSYYGTYNSGYPSSFSYSTYPIYANSYVYPGYGTYYYNPGMYNPNTTFVNPPSSLNTPTSYPIYSGTYNYANPYSTYPTYQNPYAYPGYGAYYYNPGMYNPNTTFVNPPSSLNYPTGYPMYSETYIYR